MLFLLVVSFFSCGIANAKDLRPHQFQDGSYFNDDYMYEESIVNHVRVETPSDVYVPEIEKIKPVPVKRVPIRAKKPLRKPSSAFQEVKANKGHAGDFKDVTLDSDYYSDDSPSYGQK